MKLAIISDIHANLLALETTLIEIENENVDQVICLGDVAGSGAQPNETVTRLQELQIPIVMGNVDAFILNKSSIPNELDAITRKFWEIDHWCAEQLSSENLAFIRTFKPIIQYQHSILCFHGSPQSYDDIITTETPDEVIMSSLPNNSDARILLGGHVHQQMLRRIKSYYFINSGSVGLPYEYERDNKTIYNPAYAEFTILTIESNRVSVSFRKVPYDVSQLKDIILSSGMPHADWFASDWR